MNTDSLLQSLKTISIATLNQILSLFGLFFFLGVILYLLSKYTRKIFVNSNNYKLDIYLTGWIGVPVHETGHAVFCILFGHRINEIKLFQPNSLDGTLGYVNHSYNKRNVYHQIGNFFIGAGPIIFGSIVMYLLMFFLVPNQKEISKLIFDNNIQNSNFGIEGISNFFLYTTKLVSLLFISTNFSSIYFWLFLYLSLCVSSHMQLSPADIKGMLLGLMIIIFLFFSVNVIAFLLGLKTTSIILTISSYFNLFFGIFFYAVIISSLNFLLMYLIFSLIQFIKYKQSLSLR